MTILFNLLSNRHFSFAVSLRFASVLIFSYSLVTSASGRPNCIFKCSTFWFGSVSPQNTQETASYAFHVGIFLFLLDS